MDAMKPQPTPPTPKRRWCQFSLRSLMLFTLCCAIACSWLATRAANQRKTVREILSIEGCSVTYDGDSDLEASVVAALSGRPLPVQQETWWERVFGKDVVHNVIEVSMPIAQVDRVTPQLAKLSHLKKAKIFVEHHVDDSKLDAATETVRHALPGVMIYIWDFRGDENVRQQATNLQIGNYCYWWTPDSTEAVCVAATCIGLLITL
jgi:hypothetical protein